MIKVIVGVILLLLIVLFLLPTSLGRRQRPHPFRQVPRSPRGNSTASGTSASTVAHPGLGDTTTSNGPIRKGRDTPYNEQQGALHAWYTRRMNGGKAYWESANQQSLRPSYTSYPDEIPYDYCRLEPKPWEPVSPPKEYDPAYLATILPQFVKFCFVPYTDLPWPAYLLDNTPTTACVAPWVNESINEIASHGCSIDEKLYELDNNLNNQFVVLANCADLSAMLHPVIHQVRLLAQNMDLKQITSHLNLPTEKLEILYNFLMDQGSPLPSQVQTLTAQIIELATLYTGNTTTTVPAVDPVMTQNTFVNSNSVQEPNFTQNGNFTSNNNSSAAPAQNEDPAPFDGSVFDLPLEKKAKTDKATVGKLGKYAITRDEPADTTEADAKKKRKADREAARARETARWGAKRDCSPY